MLDDQQMHDLWEAVLEQAHQDAQIARYNPDIMAWVNDRDVSRVSSFLNICAICHKAPATVRQQFIGLSPQVLQTEPSRP